MDVLESVDPYGCHWKEYLTEGRSLGLYLADNCAQLLFHYHGLFIHILYWIYLGSSIE